MADQVNFRCPGCQKVLKIPSQHLGKKVRCPGCSTDFQAGSKPAADEPEIVQAAVAAPDQFVDQPQELDPFASAAPIGNVARSRNASAKSKMTRREAVAAGKRKSREAASDLNETDMKVQSAGIFLICLPIIATVLPVFGLQLRRLARAGEYAPLTAMFLGLIGAGCIGYARRKLDDAAMLAGAAAVFVLFCGIGGFMLVRGITPVEEEVAREDRFPRMGGFEPGPPRPQIPANEAARRQEERRRNNAAANRRPFQPPQLQKPGQGAFDPARPGGANPNFGADPPDTPIIGGLGGVQPPVPGNRNANNARGAADPPFGNKLNPGNAGNNRGGLAKPQLPAKNPFLPDDNEKDDRPDAPVKNPFLDDSGDPDQPDPEPEKPEFIESLPHNFANGSARSTVHRRWGQGMMAFARTRQSKKLDKGLKFGPSIGAEQNTGMLFQYKDPILGIEVMKIAGPQFVPIPDDAFPSDDAIVDEDRHLIGVNLAFDGGNIVGIQGIFANEKEGKPDVSDTKTSHWLGQETEQVTETTAKGKAIHGFVVFSKGRDITGFALIHKK